MKKKPDLGDVKVCEIDEQWENEQEVEVQATDLVKLNLSSRELDEAKGRLVRVASMGLPLDRFGARVVLSCAQYGDTQVDDIVECMSENVRRDACTILFHLRNKKIKVGKFLSDSAARRIHLQRPSELLAWTDKS